MLNEKVLNFSRLHLDLLKRPAVVPLNSEEVQRLGFCAGITPFPTTLQLCPCCLSAEAHGHPPVTPQNQPQKASRELGQSHGVNTQDNRYNVGIKIID